MKENTMYVDLHYYRGNLKIKPSLFLLLKETHFLIQDTTVHFLTLPSSILGKVPPA